MVRMDEKTEELRDVFLDVAGEETVTESQAEPRGSLPDEAEIEERVRSTIAEMRKDYDVAPERSGEELVEIVRLFYAGEDDAAIARELGVNADDVAHARIDLHLVTDDDRDGPIDPGELRQRRDAGESITGIADDLGVGDSAIERAERVAAVEAERRVVGDRFRREFEHVLGERALSERLTEKVAEDGLEDATEGIETNVSF